jgi:anti-anti-sigma factor
MSVTEQYEGTASAPQRPSTLFSVDVNDRVNGTVVTLRGELDMSTRQHLAAALDRVDGSVMPIVLDLSGLTFIDASSVGLIHRSRDRAVERGTDLFLSSPQPHVLRVLQVTGLDTAVLC